MGSQPERKSIGCSFGEEVYWTVRAQIDQDSSVRAVTSKRSGKGNDVAIVPSPKNRAGTFRYTRLKPFSSPVLPDAASPRVNPGCEFGDDRWDGVTPDFLSDLTPLLIARAHDGYASL
jgi:hypothetical protein